MKKVIRLTESGLTNLIKRVIQEQTNPTQKVDPQMLNHVISAWGGQNAVTVKQSSIATTVTNNKTKSVIIFDLKTGMVDYDKAGSIDIMPLTMGAGFNQFKKWFDSHNNYNPLSGFTNRNYIDEKSKLGEQKDMIMKKVIRLTEADLTKLVQEVIEEQSQIKSVTDTMSKPASQSGGKLTATISKPDSNSWFSSFPCLNDVKQSDRPMVNGNIVLKTGASGQNHILLPESGKGDPSYEFAKKQNPVNGYVGQMKGGGVYYCSSESWAKGFGPQTAKIK